MLNFIMFAKFRELNDDPVLWMNGKWNFCTLSFQALI